MTLKEQRKILFGIIHDFLLWNKGITIHLYYGDGDSFKKGNPEISLPLTIDSNDNFTPYLNNNGGLLELEKARVHFREKLGKRATKEDAWTVLRFKISELEIIPEFSFASKYNSGKYLGIQFFLTTYLSELEKVKDNIIKNDLTEFEAEISLLEGNKTMRLTSFYERQLKNRIAAIEIHKTICKACGFDFGKSYGSLGEGYIEVHHLIPINSFDTERPVNPGRDLTVLCANCHRMMHRDKNKIMTVEELRGIIETNKNL